MLLCVNYEGEIMEATTQSHTSVEPTGLKGARAWFAENGLARRREQRVFTGVTGAFARRYEINPFTARVVTFAAMIGLTPLPYIALWILMPFED
jgi:phage shock protein PspC (stress-responsive transcriptional regulator)